MLALLSPRIFSVSEYHPTPTSPTEVGVFSFVVHDKPLPLR